MEYTIPGFEAWSAHLLSSPFPLPYCGIHDLGLLLIVRGPGLGGRSFRSCAACWDPSRCGGRGGWRMMCCPPVALSADPLLLPLGKARASLGPVLSSLAPSLSLSPRGRVLSAVMAWVPEDLRGTALALRIMES